jgi:excisionase family DNA binding protein
MTTEEVADLLRIERRTVYALVKRGELPGALYLGRALRFSRDAVLRWLSEGQGRVRRRRRS